jgi:hypothetical protein
MYFHDRKMICFFSRFGADRFEALIRKQGRLENYENDSRWKES